MSLYDYLSPPEPEYSDDEWDRARAVVLDALLEDGYSRQEAEVAVDDFMIAEECDRIREDQTSMWADEVLARRKDEGKR